MGELKGASTSRVTLPNIARIVRDAYIAPTPEEDHAKRTSQDGQLDRPDRVQGRGGEVWLVALDLTVGSEIQNTRLYVIVSPDELNATLRTVIVVPLTVGSRPAAVRVAVRFEGKDSLSTARASADCRSRAVDQTRWSRRE